jgi:hypothetical protein
MTRVTLTMRSGSSDIPQSKHGARNAGPAV